MCRVVGAVVLARSGVLLAVQSAVLMVALKMSPTSHPEAGTEISAGRCFGKGDAVLVLQYSLMHDNLTRSPLSTKMYREMFMQVIQETFCKWQTGFSRW